MKSMLAAFVAIFVVAIGADLILDRAGFSIEDRTSADTVRLD